MKSPVRYIMLIALVAIALFTTSCVGLVKPEDKLYHVAVFNDSQDDVKVQNLNPDVNGQGGIITLVHGPGVASWDIKKYPHTIVFTHIVTGKVLRTIQIEPNSVNGDRSHKGIDHLDAFYVYATGEWQSACAPVVTDK